MEKSSATTVLETPELLDLLTLHLTPADLLSCIQVNSQWHQTFIPTLWYTINDSWYKFLFTHTHLDGSPDAEIQVNDKVLKAFAKYGQHIRHLTLQWGATVKAASVSGVCTNLKTLELNSNWAYTFKKHAKVQPEEILKDEGGVESAITLSDPILPLFEGAFRRPSETPVHLQEGVSLTHEEIEECWVYTQRYWSLILSNPRLQRLCIASYTPPPCEPQSNDFFAKVLSNMKELKELDAVKFLDPTCFWNLYKLAPTVEKVTVSNFFENEEEGNKVLSNPGIKSLNIPDIKATTLFKILPALSNLEELTTTAITDSDSINDEQISSTIPPSGFKLKSLYLSRLDDHSDELSSIVRFLPNLKNLQTGFMDEKITEALVAHCKSFESVISGQDPWYIDEKFEDRKEFDPINHLFVSCPSLKAFDGITRFINADDLIRQPWACRGLEKFRCRIVGVKRLDNDEQTIYDKMMVKLGATSLQPGCSDDGEANLSEEERVVMQKMRQSREQQQKVYDHFASLKNLKYLDMGFENRYPWTYTEGEYYVSEHDGQEYLRYGGPIHDTLELSLESGLDRLAELKDLEVFGFDGVNHSITKKELDWMAKSWPKLKLIYGLAEDILGDIEFDRKKAELRDHLKKLRPEIRHDTLFVDNV
ncbi:hypothetical protein BGX26_006363 [Mortierella sp. AD094]|nr:hypothetical protein BGX26_006363 [Mortierella sp. AD094]